MNQGIYTITHIKSNKKYIGSSVALKRRLNRHKNELRKGIHRNKHLQRAWVKYGEEAFVFEVVEHVQDDATLLSCEQNWMDTLKKTHVLYNTCPKAGSPLGMKLTPEQRAKISTAHKGKKISDEHRKRMKEGARSRVRTQKELDHWKNMWAGKVKSPEHLAKIGASIKATWARKRAEREAKSSA